MEAALELEDDSFFADLSKQISLLIMDDDDDDKVSLTHCPSVNLQAFTQVIYPARQASTVNYDQQIGSSESKGTGVFIPRSSHPRRRSNRQGRFPAGGNNNKFNQRPSDHHRHHHHSARGPRHMAVYSDNVNNPSHYDQPFNVSKF